METHGRVQRACLTDRTGKSRRMDSLDVNKGIAAILVGGIAFFLTGLLGDLLVREELPEKPVLNIAAAPAPTAGGESKPAGPGDITPLLATADVKAGEQYTHRVCIACHTFDKGGKNGVGPNLYGVVERPHDSEPGFDYSSAMEKFKGQPWTFDALNQWLYKPSAMVPGTRMSFAGITNDKQRADVIAYLRTLSDNPVPLPKPEAKPAEAKPAEAKPAEAKPAEAKPAAASAATASGGGGAEAKPTAPQATSGPTAPAPAKQ